MTMREVSVFAPLAFLLFSVAVPGAVAASMKENLQQLKGIYVGAVGFNRDDLQGEISKERLQTYVEMRLRTAGIPVMTEKEWLGTPGNPFLLLQLDLFDANIGPVILYPHSVSLKMIQEVIVVGSSDKQIPAVTWQKSLLGSAGRQTISENVRAALEALMDRFINDYLAMNPKK